MRTAQKHLAEYECVLGVLFGDWHEVGHLSLALAGTQFDHEGLGELYDGVVIARFEDAALSVFELGFDDRLSPVATAALAEVLLWARDGAHAPDPWTFAAAVEVVSSRRVLTVAPLAAAA